MPIEIGDSTATVRSKINAVLTAAGLNPADNVDTTAATTLLNQVAGLWGVPVAFTDRMPEAEFRTAFSELEEIGGVGIYVLQQAEWNQTLYPLTINKIGGVWAASIERQDYLPDSLFVTDYYVTPTGADGANGLTPA